MWIFRGCVSRGVGAGILSTGNAIQSLADHPQIAYKGKPLEKTYQPDFVCYGEIILEIKAISSLSGIDEAQLIN